MIMHALNPGTQEAEANGSLWVRDQPCLISSGPPRAPISKDNHEIK